MNIGFNMLLSRFILVSSRGWQPEGRLQDINQKLLPQLILIECHHVLPGRTKGQLPHVVRHSLEKITGREQSTQRQRDSRPQESLSSVVAPNAVGIDGDADKEKTVNEVWDDSRCRGVQKSFIFFSQVLRVHCVELLQCEKTQISVNIEWASIIDVLVVGVVVMMSLKFLSFVGHFDQNPFVVGEGIGRVVTVVISLFGVTVGVVVSIVVSLFPHINIKMININKIQNTQTLPQYLYSVPP